MDALWFFYGFPRQVTDDKQTTADQTNSPSWLGPSEVRLYGSINVFKTGKKAQDSGYYLVTTRWRGRATQAMSKDAGCWLETKDPWQAAGVWCFRSIPLETTSWFPPSSTGMVKPHGRTGGPDAEAMEINYRWRLEAAWGFRGPRRREKVTLIVACRHRRTRFMPARESSKETRQSRGNR